jgi:hypothetical protein
LNFTGSVSGNTEELYRFDVDFGGMAQSITLSLMIGATGGSSGLDVNLVDLDELAANGTTNAVLNDFDTGTGTMTLNMTTPSYAGVHQFAVQLHTDSGSGTSPFSGDLSSTALASGAITQSGHTSIPFATGYYDLLGRGGRQIYLNQGTGTYTRDMQVDFGTGTQSITFWAQGLSGNVDGSVSIYEVSGTGSESLITTFTLDTGSSWSDDGNFTTSMRTGTVTLRVRTTISATGLYLWQLILPSTVSSVAPSGGGGGGGGDDGGCSTNGEPGLNWLALLGALAGLGVATRLRGGRG